MQTKADFDALVERAMRAREHGKMRPVIEKELLHYDILFALDQARLLDGLTFQGGTALRLCHGAPRFSEDLDFVGGRTFRAGDLSVMGECLEQAIGRRYGLEVHAKSSSEATGTEPDGVTVSRWQLSIVTAPRRPDIPRQRIRLEVANVPAYTREPLAMRGNYAFLPDGYTDTLVLTESLEEIMADKLVSLVNTKRYVRYRDIWDLRWLSQRDVRPNGELIDKKIGDYAVTHYANKLARFREQLDTVIKAPAFRNTMTRFIPVDVLERTFDRPGFLDYLIHQTDELLAETARQRDGSASVDDYRI